MAKKNCTCSQLQETIDKIFIDDSCCCQNTTVTPTDNCCSCEPVIDLIDTDKFACASFGKDRHLKYRIIREDWLTGGTNSKEVYETIIEYQASGVMLLIKVIRNDVNENSKNYILPPLEVSQDVASGVYFIKYLKFIGESLHLCTYTIRQINNDGIFYETSWESKAIDDFDITQYYNKTEIDNKFVTTTYITNNYYTGDTIDADFYKKSVLYRKDEIDDMFARKILWEKGEGHLSTQRIGARCTAAGASSFVTGLDNSGNSTGTTVTGIENSVTGDYSTATGYKNSIHGKSNFAAGQENILEAKYSVATGYSNTIIGEYSEAVGSNNLIEGNHNFSGGQNNTIKHKKDENDTVSVSSNNIDTTNNNNFAFGYQNKISGNLSTAFGNKNQIIGKIDPNGTKHGTYSLAAGNSNIIRGDASFAVGTSNTVNGKTSVALGINNVVNDNNAFAIGISNTANKFYSIALNHQSRSEGIASISGGRHSYTYMNGSCAIGTPIIVHYYAKLVNPSAQSTDADYGYLVLTNANGTPVNIGQDSIQEKRFTFTVENPYTGESSYYGELTISLTETEKHLEHNTRFPLQAIWPQIKEVNIVNENGERHLHFKPTSTDDTVWLFTHINTTNLQSGVRVIGYASGLDGCKAVERGAHAEGYGTIAKGTGSHSEGINTYTQNDGEHACGKYNYSDSDTLFSVGIGKQEYVNTDDGTDIVIQRKNALEITKDNKIYLRIKDANNNETLYDLGKMLNLLMSTLQYNEMLTQQQIDDLKVASRQETFTNVDNGNVLEIKQY